MTIKTITNTKWFVECNFQLNQVVEWEIALQVRVCSRRLEMICRNFSGIWKILSIWKRNLYFVLWVLYGIALESDISPYNAQDPSAPVNQEELHRLNNENKEIRFLVKIDRIKVRNIGNYSNVFCKFKFADKIPMKVLFSSFSSFHRHISYLLLDHTGNLNLTLIILRKKD